MTAKTATKPDYRHRNPDYTGTENLHWEDWPEEDQHFSGFSNWVTRCRCLRGYCEGRDSNCIRDPGIAAALFKTIHQEQKEEVS